MSSPQTAAKETARLEAFSDGVIAIIITIMVLEMKTPHGTSLRDLLPILPVFMSYVLSFVYLGIYWNNHHYLIHRVRKVDGRILWANLHLLFWLSLVPFGTAWLGEGHDEGLPTALYGGIMLMAAVAYYLLQSLIVAQHGKGSELAAALGRDWKGKLSLAAYAAAILLSPVAPAASDAIFVGVALAWVIPDCRVRA